jgi:hypothetical protein
MRSALPLLALCACGEEPADEEQEDTGDPPGIHCGDATTWDVTVRARVEDAAGQGVEGVTVGLDDRGYTYGLLGSGETVATGDVQFVATGVTDLPGCWGIVLDYWLVAYDDAGKVAAEDDMNTELYDAIADGTVLADVSAFPLVVE